MNRSCQNGERILKDDESLTMTDGVMGSCGVGETVYSPVIIATRMIGFQISKSFGIIEKKKKRKDLETPVHTVHGPPSHKYYVVLRP